MQLKVVAACLILPSLALTQENVISNSADDLKLQILCYYLDIAMEVLTKVAQIFTPYAITVSPEDVKFLYYQPGSDNPTTITIDNATSVIDISKNTTLVIHGWNNTSTSSGVKLLASSLNQYSSPINVIAVDYGKVAKSNYLVAAASSKSVADLVGDFILALKLPLLKVHIIGGSLGAQVAGLASQRVGKGKIGRVTGLDPASPFFELPYKVIADWRLSADDAAFVDVIHTGIPVGVVEPCGTIDFYVNSAILQPNCFRLIESDFIGAVVCSHEMSAVYYRFTIVNPTLYPGYNNSTGKMAYMGHHVTRTEGVFHVQTNET